MCESYTHNDIIAYRHLTQYMYNVHPTAAARFVSVYTIYGKHC